MKGVYLQHTPKSWDSSFREICISKGLGIIYIDIVWVLVSKAGTAVFREHNLNASLYWRQMFEKKLHGGELINTVNIYVGIKQIMGS